MSFNLPDSVTYINIQLTDIGRRMLSLGNLKFNKAVLSDREVDYGIDRTSFYNISNNRVLAPANAQPSITPFNLDGSNAIQLNPQHVVSSKQFLTADTVSSGFYSGATDNWTLLTSKTLGKATVSYAAQTWGSSDLVVGTGGANRFPSSGELVFIPWNVPTGATISPALPQLASGSPTNCLWYRVLSGSSPTITLDRPIPNFDGGPSQSTTAYFYPNNGIETFYGSATTINSNVWNLNIVRTNTVAGTFVDDIISGYTKYGSIEYNGTKRYFGFSAETPAVGFVHFTNKYSGSTYGEQLIEKSIQIYIPSIMWHNIGANNGKGVAWGASFFDLYGVSTYDPVAQTSFRELRDGIAANSRIVGRVYHKLKLVVITDQELLNALSYKSNRNYTYPDIQVNLTNSPKYPLTTTQATGLCKKNYDYFVTYMINSDVYDFSYSSYGHPPAAHCGYIKKIKGDVDINGNPQYLQIGFQSNGFPYMRDDNGMQDYASGWNANSVQILVSEQPSSLNYEIGNVPPESWIKISNLTAATASNGIYRASDYGNTTIDPLKLNGHSFILSQQDFSSGSTYVINSGLTQSQDILNFGSESFFHAIIDSQIFETNYKSVITVLASNTLVNSSNNLSFDPNLDPDIYITEVAILDELNQVVAVGKPTYPVKKNSGRYLAFQLEIDY